MRLSSAPISDTYEATPCEDDQNVNLTKAALQVRTLRKYDWHQAACLFPGFKNSPNVLRVGCRLFHYVNKEMCLTSTPLGQIGLIEQERISGSS